MHTILELEDKEGYKHVSNLSRELDITINAEYIDSFGVSLIILDIHLVKDKKVASEITSSIRTNFNFQNRLRNPNWKSRNQSKRLA